jgi:3-methylfumaryl-CoA hydratase
MVDLDMAHLQSWVGHESQTEDVISAVSACLMAATLDQDTKFEAGDVLPPGWHWLYFHEPVKVSALGPDGHVARGGFLPPAPLPRRMWAAGKLTFIQPLLIGERAMKHSRIKSVEEKQGRSGQLCFVVVEHQISVEGNLRLREEQTLVYRDAPKPGERPISEPAPRVAYCTETLQTDPVLLFRYSALTFNGHRIHYDVDYCRNVEGYPGLVVHGPLVATLLLDLFGRCYPNNPIAQFNFKAVSPLFHTQPFALHSLYDGQRGHAWAANARGELAMSAAISFS